LKADFLSRVVHDDDDDDDDGDDDRNSRFNFCIALVSVYFWIFTCPHFPVKDIQTAAFPLPFLSSLSLGPLLIRLAN
jgi:hypothetical protein